MVRTSRADTSDHASESKREREIWAKALRAGEGAMGSTEPRPPPSIASFPGCRALLGVSFDGEIGAARGVAHRGGWGRSGNVYSLGLGGFGRIGGIEWYTCMYSDGNDECHVKSPRSIADARAACIAVSRNVGLWVG